MKGYHGYSQSNKSGRLLCTNYRKLHHVVRGAMAEYALESQRNISCSSSQEEIGLR